MPAMPLMSVVEDDDDHPPTDVCANETGEEEVDALL